MNILCFEDNDFSLSCRGSKHCRGGLDVADSHIFGELHLSENLDPDPDPHQSRKLDPDLCPP
jgi:hypothetical protein